MLPSIKTLIAASFVVSFPFFSSCQQDSFSKEELAGAYQLQSPRYSGSIKLGDHGKFSQEYALNTNEAKNAEGVWEYRPPLRDTMNHGTLVIYGPIVEFRGTLTKKSEDFILSMPISKTRKGISLFLTPDGNTAYFKASK